MVELIIEEFPQLKRKKVSLEELKKAKEYLKGTLLLGLETSNSIASFLGTQKLLRNKIETPAQLFRRLNQVTAHQVQSLAQEIFVPQNLNLALITPKKELPFLANFDKINF